MKSGGALLWKEWREVRWFLVAGVAIFIGWPLLEAVGNYLQGHKFYSADMPEAMAFVLGGPFAVLVAVGVTCRDLKEKTAYFWQSRPVLIRRWAATKYLTGLAVVLIVLCVPLVLKIFIMRAEHELGQLSGILTCHTFTVILIYSISFFAGCLIRTPVYAAIFSGALALLVYFLPVLTPPLEGFSVFNIMMESPIQIVQSGTSAQGDPWIAEKMRVVKIPWTDDLALRYSTDLLRYIAFALVGSFAVVVLSGIVVKKNWRLKVGQKLMFWLLGGVGMFLFLTVVFQLRSNLECVRQIPLKPESKGTYNNVEAIACDGDKGVLLLRFVRHDNDANELPYNSLMTFDLSAKEPFGEEIVISKDSQMALWSGFSRGQLVWSAKRPQWTYFIERSSSKNETDGKYRVDKTNLLTISLTNRGVMTVVDKLDLMPYLGDRVCHRLYMYNDTIYANAQDKLLIFDVDSSGKPVLRKVINEQFGILDGFGRFTKEQLRKNTLSMRLVPADGLSVEERLKITLELTSYSLMASEGGDIVVAADLPLTMYQLKEVKDNNATLEIIGHYRPTPLERFVGPFPTQVLLVRDGLAYVTGVGLGGISVYDVRRPQQIRRVGHYAAPKERFRAIAPLPDGNILVAGNKLHIVAPPKVKR